MKRSLEERAKEFATIAHAKQKRKYTNDPYIIHPAAVVEIIRPLPKCDEDMLAAAWLHDTVEDCPGVTVELIDSLFGAQVGDMVDDLSERKIPDANRALRKWVYADRIREASPGAKTIKLADLIDNSSSIVQHDAKFASTYLKEKRYLLGMLTHGDPTLWSRADEICKKAGY